MTESEDTPVIAEPPKFFSKTLCFVIIIALGPFSLGFALSFYSPAFETIVPYFNLTSIEQTTFNSLASICAVFGAPLLNLILPKLGHKITLFIIALTFIIGWVLIIASFPSVLALLFIGRAITGLACGAASTIAPVYISEISPSDLRGSYGVMSQFSVSIACTLSYLLGLIKNWRIAGIISAVPPLLLCLLVWFVPDSPVKMENQASTESIFQKKFIKPFIISFLTVFFQQFSGINAFLTNLTPIFSQSSLNWPPPVSSSIVALAQVITNAVATPIVDKIGRKLTWNISSLGQIIFLYLFWANETWNFTIYLPIVCLFLDVLMFGIGISPLPWFIMTEQFPDSIRSLGCSIIQCTNWILCSVMIFVFPLMSNAMGMNWTFFFYGSSMVLSLLFGLFVLNETSTKIQNLEKTDE